MDGWMDGWMVNSSIIKKSKYKIRMKIFCSTCQYAAKIIIEVNRLCMM